MQLDLENIDRRIERFVKYFADNISSDPDRNFRALRSRCDALDDPEEKLFFILLTTHFDSPYLADEFHKKVTWNKIQRIDEVSIRQVCKEYIFVKQFTGEYLIGDHRRYFRCLSKDEKVDYSVKILASYKQAIKKYNSQAAFFEIHNITVDFEVLYDRMKDEIANFHQRLPRFDHLERVSRIHSFYVIPQRFYAEDATGPLYGLTCLLFGKRVGKDKGITRQDLIDTLPPIWNKQIGSSYTIPDGADFKQVIACLERWVVNRVQNWETLLSEKRDDKAFVFDIESCLCNWQKGKCINGS
jgi:hypothetical protein